VEVPRRCSCARAAVSGRLGVVVLVVPILAITPFAYAAIRPAFGAELVQNAR